MVTLFEVMLLRQKSSVVLAHFQPTHHFLPSQDKTAETPKALDIYQNIF